MAGSMLSHPSTNGAGTPNTVFQLQDMGQVSRDEEPRQSIPRADGMALSRFLAQQPPFTTLDPSQL